MLAAHDDPFERGARPPGRAIPQHSFHLGTLDPEDPALGAHLRGWDWVARSLLSRAALTAPTRVKLEDSRRIVGELLAVIAGEDPGYGPAAGRSVLVAARDGVVQAVTTTFTCERAVFIELLATAPWNLLGAGDPADARTVRGAGTAVLLEAARQSVAAGLGGRVTLQAENPRSRVVYERLGFEPMRASDVPRSLVPAGADALAAAERIARGAPGPEELRAPWMVWEPLRAPEARAVAAEAGAVSAAR